MPRGKAITTHARELSKVLSPEQLRELSSHLLTEAEKPRVDKKAHTKARKDIQSAYIKLQTAEERLTAILTEAGKSNAEINEEIKELERTAERNRVTTAAEDPAPPAGRGRRKQTPAA